MVQGGNDLNTLHEAIIHTAWVGGSRVRYLEVPSLNTAYLAIRWIDHFGRIVQTQVFQTPKKTPVHERHARPLTRTSGNLALEAKLLEKENILFRKAIAPEKHLVSAWVKEHFGAYWQSEVEVAFSRQPVSCWIAQRGNWILGFACYESTARNFFSDPLALWRPSAGRE